MTISPLLGNWSDTRLIEQKRYRCGYCDTTVGPNVGYRAVYGSRETANYVYLCSYCNRPTFFEAARQTPSSTFGDVVDELPGDVEQVYKEARDCMRVQAFTASVLTLRKLLMHVAVDQKAPEGQKFVQYVDYLDQEHLVPAGAKQWVDRIRQKGNEANHEIGIMEQEDAEDLISFAEMLLKNVYEFPARGQRMVP